VNLGGNLFRIVRLAKNILHIVVNGVVKVFDQIVHIVIIGLEVPNTYSPGNALLLLQFVIVVVHQVHDCCNKCQKYNKTYVNGHLYTKIN